STTTLGGNEVMGRTFGERTRESCTKSLVRELELGRLAERVCIPCRGDVPPLSAEEIAPLRAQLEAGWEVVERPNPKHGSVTLLNRTYKFRNFAEALNATVRIGEMAEEQQHHPDLHLAWGRLGIEIWTHKIGGLTESDFIFAAKCDALLAGNAA
ncbi:MAG TPA: 4a-hydroxytetrahydrobiopterin dehydratase, partial [Candidatus Nitrosotalea sp.]|nr:4a-hydroxytetrahydrobiopterin dehydratase [Candidatus Nitrosotalea sp.]